MSIENLLKIVYPASSDEESVLIWSEQLGLMSLLEEQRTTTSIMLYGSSFNTGSILLRSILVPEEDIKDIAEDDLINWESPYGSWSCGLVQGGGLPARVEFDKPCFRIGSKILERGQQLVFGRTFEGRVEDKHYFEIAQFLTHAYDLHWTPERHAWCRFDEHGDIEDVIKWSEDIGHGGYETAAMIEISREIIEMQMSATGTVLIQMFDSTCVPKGFHGWGQGEEHLVKDVKQGLYFHSHLEGRNGSYFRGIQIIRPQQTAQELGAYLQALENQPKDYESFITQDWKNNRITEVDCGPESIASYFEKDSPLPY